MGEGRGVYSVLVGKPEGKSSYDNKILISSTIFIPKNDKGISFYLNTIVCHLLSPRINAAHPAPAHSRVAQRREVTKILVT
jgi:hypothetical protein